MQEGTLIIALNFNRADDKVNEIWEQQRKNYFILQWCYEWVDEKWILPNKHHNCLSKVSNRQNYCYCWQNLGLSCKHFEGCAWHFAFLTPIFMALQLATLWLTTFCLTPLQLKTLQLTKILLMTSWLLSYDQLKTSVYPLYFS